MKGNRAVLAVVVAAVLLGVAWWMFSRGETVAAVNLIERFDTATKAPAAETFAIVDADLNGETRRAIFAPPDTRLTYTVQVPEDAWLKVEVGLKPEAWQQEGDGVLFFVGVSDGTRFDELFNQLVNPFSNPGDRKWIPVWVDLSAYAGEEIKLIFNTRTGPPERAGDARNDAALWGAPEIVVR